MPYPLALLVVHDYVLRQVDGAFKISHRRIDLAQKVLPTTISIFF